MHSSKLDVDGRSVDLHLVDTSGADDFESMWPNWFQAVQGALLVYAVDDADSFAALPTFSKAIRAANRKRAVALIVVGTKTDLERTVRYSHTPGDRERESGVQ
mmetsp:Transcript_49049/g.106516  ORF Transcript_49049/g.106516 Transcript_49049/m.106516 type:complete len:103 (-) Transcript_49049:331-639(-)